MRRATRRDRSFAKLNGEPSCFAYPIPTSAYNAGAHRRYCIPFGSRRSSLRSVLAQSSRCMAERVRGQCRIFALSQHVRWRHAGVPEDPDSKGGSTNTKRASIRRRTRCSLDPIRGGRMACVDQLQSLPPYNAQPERDAAAHYQSERGRPLTSRSSSFRTAWLESSLLLPQRRTSSGL
jgi:hypothetical protein